MLIPLIVALVVMGVGFALSFTSLPPQIPLFYSKTQGEDQIGDVWLIFILPILLFIFFAINLTISKRFFSADKVVQDMIRYISIVEAIVITLLFLKILITVT